MPNAHPHPWRAGSLFGDGPRRPLDREQRARFKFLLNAHRRVRRISPLTETVGNALVKRLSVDGRCDPSHDTLAADVGCCARTVRRGLEALRQLGLVLWQRRIIRVGQSIEQTSNSYLLSPAATPNPPAAPRISSEGQSGRQTKRIEIQPTLFAEIATPAQIAAAQAVLAARRKAVEASLLRKRSG